MNRKEFEKTLKRALELQSSQQDNAYSEEELRIAARQLQIPDALIDQAIGETEKEKKQFRVLGSPEEVQEAFLKKFLFNDTVIHTGQGVAIPALKIDKQSIKLGQDSSFSLRVEDPRFVGVTTTISFIPDGQNGTVVKWSEISAINWLANIKKNFLLFLIPLSMAIIPTVFLINGQWLISIVTTLFIALTALIMSAAILSERKRIDGVLTGYFENLEMFGNLQKQAALEKEVKQLREKQTVIESFSFENQSTKENNLEIEPHLRQREKQKN